MNYFLKRDTHPESHKSSAAPKAATSSENQSQDAADIVHSGK
jgi:hypothetical protein